MITIRENKDMINKIDYIKNWLIDFPFSDMKKPSTSEVIRISINHFYNWIKESNK